MECERIEIRTFRCRPSEFREALGVTATAFTHFSDGSERPYPEGWQNGDAARVTLFFDAALGFHNFGSVQTDFRFCDNELRYRLLSRCVQDCKYFLGPGSRFSKYLWGGSVASHIKAMHILWDSFSPSQKPEWTSLEDIEDFSKKMMVEEVF